MTSVCPASQSVEQEQNPAAERIAAEFKDYAYSVSHDLSAPVRAMVEFSKLLGGEHAEALSDEAQEYLSVIVESGQKMQTMMDGLLTYSRLNTMAKPLVVVDCQRVLENCQVILKDEITAARATIQMGQLPTVRGDIDQLTQLFMILLDNALTYQPANHAPVISVEAEKTGGFWQITVVDNGIGIDPKYHDRIFKLFQRLHADHEYPGVGMGLPLAQKIVARHGGEIACRSALGVGEGAAFCVTLPDNISGTGG